MKKRWVTVLVVCSIIILALAMSGMILGVVFGDKIKQMAIMELNKHLATEVKVNGEISFSVFRNFPHASVIFHETEIKETLPERANLLTAEKISLLFNFWDLFGSNYSMKKIIVENGELSVKVTRDGTTNYNIFKNSGGKDPSDFSLRIQDAKLSNITIHYDDERSNQHYHLVTSSSSFAGDFYNDNFLLEIKSDLKSKNLTVQGIDYLPERLSQIEGKLHVDLRQNIYTIQDAKLIIEGNPFVISGTIHADPTGNEIHLKVSADNLQVDEIAALLPARYTEYFSHFRSKGNIRFHGEIDGIVSAASNPSINIRFGVKNGTFSHDEMKSSFEQVNFKGSYSNGSAASLGTSSIQLNEFSASFDGNPVSGSFAISNFREPFLDVKLNGELSLEKIFPLFTSEMVRELSGAITFRQFYYKGMIEQLSPKTNLNKIEAGGNFELNEVKIGTTRGTYDHINGTFDITNNQLKLNRLSLKAKDSDLAFDGTITNFIPYLLSSMNDSIINVQKIGVDVRLAANELKWEDIVGANTTSSTAHEGTSGGYTIPSFFYVITGSVTGKIEKFSYQKFNASAVHGNILLLGNMIYFNDFGLKAEKGSVSMNGKLDITHINRNKLDLTARLDHLDISQLFYELNDFDQEVLTHKHLKGVVTTQIALQSTWEMRKLNKHKLYAVADVKVEDGELNGFEPMLALAKFVKISELKNIRFSRIENQVEIKNQKVYIPTMKIYTNALNVQLSGTHSFDNIIDYKVQLNLLKLLTSKFGKTTYEPDASDQSIEGFLNLYLSMTGPAANPVIKYDKQAVKQKIASDLKKEKNELKDVLKKEFDSQEQSQQEIKDHSVPEEIQYMEFEDDSTNAIGDEMEKDESITKQNQKQELDNFKSIFKPKTPPK